MAPLCILHVEDDPDDAFFFSRAIKNASPGCDLHRAVNGESAIAFLRKTLSENKGDAHPVPDVMVLDLKLPGLSGFDVLAWTRKQCELETLPIVILSGSPLAQDKNKASQLGASDFIVKNSDYDQIALQVLQLLSKNSPGLTLESSVPPSGKNQ